jgi:hypothetical protein
MTTTKPEQTRDQIAAGNIANAQAVAIGAGATAVYQGLSVAEVAVLVTELKRVDQPTAWDGHIPYIGLSAFQESDAQFFFGRESARPGGKLRFAPYAKVKSPLSKQLAAT